MIFKAKVKTKPKVGDIKREFRFSFLPTKINDTWYWLEFYEVEQLFIGRNYDYWVDNKFYYCGELIYDKNIPAIPPDPFRETRKAINNYKCK